MVANARGCRGPSCIPTVTPYHVGVTPMRRFTWSTVLLFAACFQPSDLTGDAETSGGSGGSGGSSDATMSPTTDVTSSPTSTPPTTEADSSTSPSTTDPTDSTDPTDATDSTDDDPSTTDPTDTTTGPAPAQCDDGIETPGELCLGGAGLVMSSDVAFDARLVDVDSDDVADLVYLISDSLIVHQGVGDGTFGPDLFATTVFPTAAEIGDIDGDGEIDVAVVDGNAGTVEVVFGDGEGNFDLDPLAYGFKSLPSTLAVYDLDGAFGDEVLVSQAAGLSVFVSDGQGFPTGDSGFGTQGNMRSIVGGDFDSDGDPDVAYIRVPLAGPVVEMRLGNGDGSFSSVVAVDHDGSDPRAVTSGDFDGDGDDDLAYVDSTADVLYVQLGNGAAGFAAATASATDSAPSRLVAADFTGDGTVDVAVGHTGANTIWAFANDGSGAFADPVEIGVAATVDSLALGFANDDGVPDMVSSNVDSGLISLVLSNP